MQEENIKNTKSDAALREEKVLEFWRENQIFQKSMTQREGGKEFVFYDGPPTANGKPGTHHLIPGSFKDAIPRYKTMQGFHVRRKRGWDTHGLPVELQVEKKLGLNSKKAIEEYGIAKFNEECKKSVWEYLDVWQKFTERIGHWIDLKDPYVTYHNDYIESVWNVLQKVNDQKLLYKDYKVVPWCPRCGTALSSHELAQGYEDVKDLSVYVKFKVKGQENTYILAWTTTPWTLPGNVALAVGKDIEYVKVKILKKLPLAITPLEIDSPKGNKIEKEYLIFAKERLSEMKDALEITYAKYEIVEELKGSDLVGLEYEPLFDELKTHMQTSELQQKEFSNWKNGWKVYAADFVTTTDGTGVVHTAVMYGQDDFALGTKENLPKVHTVDSNGNFIAGVSPNFLMGRFVREVNADGKPTLAVDIIDDLKKRNLFFKQENYKHSYPHCWRCHTALIYYARDSWYIRMSDPKIKGELISENKKIDWEPEYTREGRFGEWLREIKDWAISRERYWGTPLPVWECLECKKVEVIGSIKDLKQNTKKSGNKYFLMRHGESESNIKDSMHGVVSSRAENIDNLTARGLDQVNNTAELLKEEKIDLVYVSPFMRTRETLKVLREKLNFTDDQIIFDKRLGELDAGEFEGKTWDEYRNMFKSERERFLDPIHGGESLLDVKKRVGDVFYELENKYQDKNILVISHGSPLWMLYAVVNGYDVDESIDMTGGLFRHTDQVAEGVSANFNLFANAEMRILDFVPIPHNASYELDLHKPFIDSIKLKCDCGGDLIRTKEVMDVWFDSGAMPFAQDHYPFDFAQGKPFADKKLAYPADYISEAIDQTRGWFYTLHAVGVLMGRGLAYKNVICLGHLLDAKGKKMSKSLGNIVEPFEVMNKYGADTLRLWMYSVNQPGESKNFDEKTVLLLSQQVFGLLYNVLAFYELYRDKELENQEFSVSRNALDIWIIAKINNLIETSTQNLDKYKLLEPVRSIRDFIGELSTLYLRSSRDRIKNGDLEAKETLYFILKNLAKLMSPFAPFTAEDIWLKLRNEKDEESVHLSEWPVPIGDIHSRPSRNILSENEVIRDFVHIWETCSLVHKLRQENNLVVKQPLSEVFIYTNFLNSSYQEQYFEIIKNEINVEKVTVNMDGVFEEKLDWVSAKTENTWIQLCIKLDSELIEKGQYRKLVRAIQDIRKKIGLIPADVISISVETDQNGQSLIEKFKNELLKTVGAEKVEFTENDGPARNASGIADAGGEEIKVDSLVFKVKIAKI